LLDDHLQQINFRIFYYNFKRCNFYTIFPDTVANECRLYLFDDYTWKKLILKSNNFSSKNLFQCIPNQNKLVKILFFVLHIENVFKLFCCSWATFQLHIFNGFPKLKILYGNIWLTSSSFSTAFIRGHPWIISGY
jgi:hypothetical protein